MGQECNETNNKNEINELEKRLRRIGDDEESSYHDNSRLSRMKNMISNIEKKIFNLNDENNKLRNENDELKKETKYDYLKKENDKLRNENDKLKNENYKLKNKNDKLNKENSNLTNENDKLKNKISNLINENELLKKENNNLKNENNDLIKSKKQESQIMKPKNYFNKNNIDLKKEVLDNQKQMRKNTAYNTINTNPIIKNIKLNQLLEDMCIYGNIIKKEINAQNNYNHNYNNYNNNNNKVIKINDALKSENSDKGLFALGLLAHNLENCGIETIIDSENSKDEDEATTSLQFISNGLIYRKKYDLHFEFGQKRNEELLKNKNEYEKFKQRLKSKLSKDYNIPMDSIIVTFPQKGSFHVQIIFQSEEFNNLDLNDFKNKFKNDLEFDELNNLKEIHTDVIMSACRLSKNQLDPRGNRSDGWGIGEKRGNKEYIPPLGWTGIGLKVIDKYDNNKWIGMSNDPDEWCVAYHGVGSNCSNSNNVKQITGLIYKSYFKVGSRQAHSNCPDKFHMGQKVGDGVYCTPDIKTAEGYAGDSIINGKSYKTVLMVRVKPDAIRSCNCVKDYWVVNGTNDEIRPYRILYKCK